MYLTRVFKSLRCCVFIGEYSTRFFMILGTAATFMSQLLGWSYESTIYYSVLPSSFYSVPCSVHSSVLFLLLCCLLCSLLYSLLCSLLYSLLSTFSLHLPLLPCPMSAAAAQFLLLLQLLLSPFAAFNCRQFVCFAAGCCPSRVSTTHIHTI